MPSIFVKYRDFSEREEATDFASVLKSNGIEYELEEVKDQLGSVYGATPLQYLITIKVRQEDFSKIDSLLLADAAKQVDNVDKDHYLFGFSNEELYDILSKPDEWSPLDYQLARKILRDRGIELQDQVVDMMKDQRIQQLAQPEPSNNALIYGGYLCSVLLGFIGAFIGWHLMSSKKVLPNGQRVGAYSDNDRKHGFRIFVIGIVMSVVGLALKFITD